MLAKNKQFLFIKRHPPSYSYDKDTCHLTHMIKTPIKTHMIKSSKCLFGDRGKQKYVQTGKDQLLFEKLIFCIL